MGRRERQDIVALSSGHGIFKILLNFQTQQSSKLSIVTPTLMNKEASTVLLICPKAKSCTNSLVPESMSIPVHHTAEPGRQIQGPSFRYKQKPSRKYSCLETDTQKIRKTISSNEVISNEITLVK